MFVHFVIGVLSYFPIFKDECLGIVLKNSDLS